MKILLTRENASMENTWTEHLCLSQRPGRRLRLGTYSREWLGSIHEIVPEAQRFNAVTGELVVPRVVYGRRVVGLADGEYLESENLVETDDFAECSVDDLAPAQRMCAGSGWNRHRFYAEAWDEVRSLAAFLAQDDTPSCIHASWPVRADEGGAAEDRAALEFMPCRIGFEVYGRQTVHGQEMVHPQPLLRSLLPLDWRSASEAAFSLRDITPPSLAADRVLVQGLPQWAAQGLAQMLADKRALQ